VRFSPKGPQARLVLIWAAWSATILILAQAAQTLPGEIPDRLRLGAVAESVPPLARWDSGWYYRIITEGYSYGPQSAETSVGFYPLYPILVRAIVSVVHTPIFWTGIALSLLCLLGSLFFIADLARMWEPDDDPRYTIDGILFFPTAFFFASFYTESLFLLTTAAALWGARRGRWLVAAVGAAGAGLTRLNGVLILLPIVMLAAAEAGWRLRGLRGKHFLALLGGIAGAAAYPAYLWYRWGSPLLYVRAKNNVIGVTQGFRPPTHLARLALKKIWELVSGIGLGGQIRSWLELSSLLGFTVLVFLLFRRRLLPEATYCAATVLLFWCAGSFDAIDRYVLALFPGFFLIGHLLRRRETVDFVYRFAGASLNTFLLVRFVRGVWVA
jgi:hypothetical protein